MALNERAAPTSSPPPFPGFNRSPHARCEPAIDAVLRSFAPTIPSRMRPKLWLGHLPPRRINLIGGRETRESSRDNRANRDGTPTERALGRELARRIRQAAACRIGAWPRLPPCREA